MNVVWTSEAEQTYAKNLLYLKNEWNGKVISNFISNTNKAIHSIKLNPDLFPVVDKKKKIHKCLVVKQISLYYKIKEDRIDLLTFWNNYQNPKKLKIK